MNDSRNAEGTGIVLHAEKLVKRYEEGGHSLEVLGGVDLSVQQGDILAIIGASGSGKSTLLNLLGGLDRASSGSVAIAGNALAELNDRETGRLRNRYLGFVYQFHHLLPEFTALENVAMPLLIRGDKPADCQQRAADMLAKVGLEHRLKHKPSALSGGERQRVAIARALVTEPALVMADEPTGNLDERTAAQVQSLMLELNESLGTAFMIVTHDSEFASRCPQQYELHDGLLRRL
ncbi:MAG: lipoprotein-releasing ABC transporter ATP-binding protein LolD [Pseudomonadales bacterium]|nr:lipoprotein-releasing ABC transporter ATP-binding protein LolD [Pseudomonadales bacterium]